ncbi:MAG TPA: hypothetical protein VKV80_05500 [Streptosporangiaceae bacterium]|nr:hypothetical protein [Streptosporangiaceae bacterium]
MMKGTGFLERITLAEFLSRHFAAARKGPLNAEALGEMVTGERMAAVFGGRVAAWVSLPRPATRVRVVSEPAFRAWVKKHMPDEVVTVEQVREASQRAILDQAKANGGRWLNRETGEYVPVDGIEVAAGDPAPRVELTPDAAEVIGAAWRDGEIDLGPMLALPAGGEHGA